MLKRFFKGALFGPLFLGGAAIAEPVPVELRQTEQGWQLLRGGEPYLIRGAGGTHSLEELAAAGGNSIRTWDAENIGPLLDEAHSHGLTVTVGIWLGHERHGFDYSDPKQVREQFERAKGFVEQYKDHPAVLMWAIGNEMEGFEEGDNPAIWEAVNDIGEMVKELDPNHPTMTVTAFVHGERIDYIHNRMPAIDIHGINAYGGAVVVPDFLRDGGASKPYILTEFGPVGTWEMPKTEWGAPYEQTSNEKGDFYRRTWDEAIIAQQGTALGGYAFLWGYKMEGTSTWFGMVLEDGAKTAAYDVMSAAWNGEAPDNLAPVTSSIRIEGNTRFEPGDEFSVNVDVSDPEGESLDVRWILRPESGDYMTGGDFRPNMPDIPEAVIESGASSATVRLPEQPGPYRLFMYAYDQSGKVATANLPVLVEGEFQMRFPVAVYEDRFENMPWAPSGWMGNTEKLTVDGQHPDNPRSGNASIRLRYEGVFNWVGVVWQHPANNWGDQEGGIDMTGARALEFWMRGEYGGEKVGFGVGLLERDREFPDSSITKYEGVPLSSEWSRFEIPLEDKDLSSLKSGFWVTLTGRRKPVTIYIDDIRFID